MLIVYCDSFGLGMKLNGSLAAFSASALENYYVSTPTEARSNSLDEDDLRAEDSLLFDLPRDSFPYSTLSSEIIEHFKSNGLSA